MHLFNLTTGDSQPVTTANPSLTPNHILVLPNESPEDLATLQLNYQQEFPGDTHLLRTLRHRLVKADWQLRRLDTAFTQLQFQLHQTGLPMHHWDTRTHRVLKTHQHHLSHADRDFQRAHKALQSAHNQSPKPEQTKPEAPPKPGSPVTYYQTAEIKLVDGKTVTKILDCDAAYWLSKPSWPHAAGFARQLWFEDLIVPEPYQYALTHNDVAQAPCRCITIKYSPQEFMRLCRLEIDSNSEHLLDGKRLDYARLV
jgi:hypothetical protein